MKVVFNNDFSSAKTLSNISGCYGVDKLFPKDACASMLCGNVLQAKVEASDIQRVWTELSWGFLCSKSRQSHLVAELLPVSNEETWTKTF